MQDWLTGEYMVWPQELLAEVPLNQEIVVLHLLSLRFDVQREPFGSRIEGE